MKTRIPNLFVAGFVALILLAFTMQDKSGRSSENGIENITLAVDSKLIDGNNITAWFRNNGSFHRDPQTGNSGLMWPSGTNKYLTYASGLWLAAKSGSDTLVAVAEYVYEYLPGYVDNNGNPQGKDDPDYHVYKIVKGDTLSADYVNWPVNQGAYLDSLNKPFLPGSQTLFFSMTDGYPESHYSNAGSTAPMKAQVQVTVWCYNNSSEPVLRNVNFTEFKIINRSNLTWNDAIITIWSDACSREDIALGCDSLNDICFAFCKPNSSQYGTQPPAFGFVALQGPVRYTGNVNDTVYSYVPGKSRKRIRVGYKEVDFSSFCPRQNSTYGDPSNYRETYNIMQGLTKTGMPYINPFTNQPTKFPYSGDPETQTGWLWPTFGNDRYNMNFGFTDLNPGDTQTVVIAKLVSQGTNNLNSVTKLKADAQYIKKLFEQNFTTVDVKQLSNIIPEGFKLYQNYPNPFNPVTKITFDIPSHAGSNNSEVRLVIYNSLGNEVATLLNSNLREGRYEVEFNGSNLPSGVYFCRLMYEGNFATAKMLLLK